MIVIEEMDDTKIPKDLNENIKAFVESVIIHNKTKMLFSHYRESGAG
jgi:hypothetical protein